MTPSLPSGDAPAPARDRHLSYAQASTVGDALRRKLVAAALLLLLAVAAVTWLVVDRGQREVQRLGLDYAQGYAVDRPTLIGERAAALA